MNVLIIGSGGREHAIALKINQSKKLTSLYCLPGNPGTKQIASNILIDVNNHSLVVKFCNNNKIDLIIIGPEQPLVDGLSDELRKNNFKVFGPSASAALIESSKSFAKKIMMDAGVPTAKFKEFDIVQIKSAFDYIESVEYPLVIKADGLAAGKGVFICNDFNEAEKAIKEIFNEKVFGESGNKIVIEEFLEGDEASIFAITDGVNFICLPAAQDHKRIGDSDTGKNTGGMGAYAPTPLIDDFLLKQIKDSIIKPTLNQMLNTGNKFVGCLFAGLIITKSGPKVIEFNCRFGDPETQVVLPILDGDFLQLLYSAASEKLDINSVKYSFGTAVCIVAASEGYPDNYKKGFEIFGLNQNDDDIIIYHAGTKNDNDKIITNGGRVLGVTCVVKKIDIQKAISKAYEAISKIYFEGIYFRKDIGAKALKYLNKKP